MDPTEHAPTDDDGLASRESEADDIAARSVEVLSAVEEIAAAYLFGSVARAEQTSWSDADFGVILGPGLAAERKAEIRLNLAADLEGVVSPRGVDVVVLEDQPPTFVHQVLLDARLVFERDRVRRLDVETDAIARALDFQVFLRLGKDLEIPGLLQRISRHDE